MRCSTLRTVSAGPTMREPGIVGRRICAPTTPHGMPSSSITSDTMPVASPSARKPSITPCGGRGTCISLMFSRAMRPVRRFSDMVAPVQSRWMFARLITADSRSVSSRRNRREVLRAAAHDVGALFGEARAHRVAAQRGRDLAVERGDDRGRRLRRREQPEPGAGEIVDALFAKRRHAGQRGGARLGRDRERLQARRSGSAAAPRGCRRAASALRRAAPPWWRGCRRRRGCAASWCR